MDKRLDEREQEIERLNNIINKIDKYANKLRYYTDEDDEGYRISKDIHNIIQELEGSDKEWEEALKKWIKD